MVIPGTVLVFLATWLYMEVAPPKQMKEKGGYDHSPAMKRVQGAWTLVRLSNCSPYRTKFVLIAWASALRGRHSRRA